jgi:outer membrane lipoprotein-sorting protein
VIRPAVILTLVLCVLPCGAAPDEAAEELLDRLAARNATVTDLEATYRQRKHTPIMTRPHLSSGRVRVKGKITRWDLLEPHHRTELHTGDEVHVYYPDDKALEIITLDPRLRRLKASPLPHPKDLRALFSIRAADLSDEEMTDVPGGRALEMTPTDPWIAERITRVRLVVDPQRDLVTRVAFTDIDGERTVQIFENIRVNPGLTDADLALDVPADVKITRVRADTP